MVLSPDHRLGSDASRGRGSTESYSSALSKPVPFSEIQKGVRKASDRSMQRLSRASSISTIVTGIYDLSTGNIDVRASGNFLVVQGRHSQPSDSRRLRISIPHLTSMASMQTSRIYGSRASMDVDALTARSGRKSSAHATGRGRAKDGIGSPSSQPGQAKMKKSGSVRTTLEGAGVAPDSAAMVFMLGGLNTKGKEGGSGRAKHERVASGEM